MSQKQYRKITTIRLTVTGVLMAMNIALSSFGIPVPGGRLYLCDVVISLAAILLNPFEAFVVGGVGSFLGDLLFYPAPMFVSLVTHGLQAAVISVFSHKILKSKPILASGIGVTIGAVIMVIGYTLGKIYVYSTFEYAMVKLPYEIAQGAIGAIFGMLLCWKCGIHKLFDTMINRKTDLFA
ncbi:ECF transporter S component [Defluviitalea saccharophila]|uniref:ECF transporter S component n=1 Tax=Defluviitalea saccharophila TaxID=879970 RepID=A0ABZ2Y2M9_9FIRM